MFKAETSLKKLLLIYILWIAASVFSASLIYLYFKDAGVVESDLVASFFFSVFSAILIIVLLNNRQYDFRKPISFGILLMGFSYIMLFLLPPTKELLFIYSAAMGANFFLFWVPFNIMYFERSHEKAAIFGSIYFSMWPIISLVFPLASGLVAEDYGFRTLFLISAIAYIAMSPVVYILQSREYTYVLTGCLGEIKGFKTLLFLEGAYGGGMMAALAVIALFYFTNPIGLGVFISVTTIFSVIASFIVSSLSDKARKRKFYIRIFGVGLGLTTMAASLAGSAGAWYTVVSSRNFFATLFMPFTTAIITDSRRKIADFMVGRELLLNIGRVFGVAIVFACSFFLSNIHLSLAFLGFIILFYPVVIELKRKHISVN